MHHGESNNADVKKCRIGESNIAKCHECLSDLLSVASLKSKNDDEIISHICHFIDEYGIEPVCGWSSNDKHHHKVVHVLTNFSKQKAIEALANRLGQINAQRDSDKCTPLHLSAWKKNIDLTKVLLELGADPLIENSYGENSIKLQELVQKSKQICFLDLELTHFALPSEESNTILEVAILITDADLVEISRREWVVSKTESELEKLSEWHKKTFNDVENGGNGLFKAIKSAEALPFEQVAAEVFAFVKEYCPEKCCPLGGFSVHCDREVLKREIPAVYNYLSHQIVDVSTILQLASRWQPAKLIGKPKAPEGNHRAMVDVVHSIETLKFARENFFA